MYDLVVAFADAGSCELLCLEHPLPFATGEEVWFDAPLAQSGALQAKAHVLAAGASGTREITVVVPVEVEPEEAVTSGV